MKKLIALSAFILCLTYGSAQVYEEKFLLSAGTNIISNSNSDGNRFTIKDVDFEMPFFVGIEHKLSRWFGVEAIALSNKIKGYEEVNGTPREYRYRYLAGDVNLKLYFEDLLTRRYQNNWDMFLVGGAGGYRMLGDNHLTINLGGGMQYWFSDHFGVGAKALGKVGVGTVNEQVNNYYQLTLGLMYRI